MRLGLITDVHEHVESLRVVRTHLDQGDQQRKIKRRPRWGRRSFASRQGERRGGDATREPTVVELCQNYRQPSSINVKTACRWTPS